MYSFFGFPLIFWFFSMPVAKPETNGHYDNFFCGSKTKMCVVGASGQLLDG